jgi:predicted O-methyltransferase YrrM
MHDKEQLSNLINSIALRSKADKIPMVRKQTIDLIVNFINEHQCQTILEIGTGYGYSAYVMATCVSVKQLITIEKSKINFDIAQSFLAKTPSITCLNLNAFDYEPTQKFDLILIDGPKSHQDVLVNKYLPYLTSNGHVIIDNIFFKKISNLTNLTRNQKSLLEKVEKFRH